MLIRRMEESDIQAMVDMGVAMVNESSTYESDFLSPTRIGVLADALLRDPDQAAWLAVDAGPTPIGMLLGFVVDDPLFDYRVAGEHLLYVRPENRGGTTAIRLIRAFEAWAKDRGARYARPGITTMIHPDRTARLYQALGYEPIGYCLRKEL